jgi:hypothetical protein
MRKILTGFWKAHRTLLMLGALGVPSVLPAQSNLLTVAPPQKIAVKRGAMAEVKLAAKVQDGYHVNSDTPTEEYLIALKLKWEPGPLLSTETAYPKAEMQKYEFSEKPLSVFTGEFQIAARFKVDGNAAPGPGILVGKLRYQACSHDTCYRPATAEIRLPYEIQ